MEFLTTPRPPPGPPAMDLEEPRDTLVLSQDLTPGCQWDPVPRGPSSLSQMELDGPNIQELVQQFEALPGDLGGLSPDGPPCPLHIATGHGQAPQDLADAHGLLSAEAGRDDLLNLLHLEECPSSQSCPKEPADPAPRPLQPPEDPEGDTGPQEWGEGASAKRHGSRSSNSSPEPWLETVPLIASEERPAGAQSPETVASYPALQEVSGPCEHEDLLDGVIFGAKYLGSTQLVSERNPPPSTRMAQAQEAVDRVKAPDGETQPMTEVDLFISTKRVKVLMADSQEAMMDHALQTISYIADIGSVLVIMARRRLTRRPAPEAQGRRLYKMICHVFHSEDVSGPAHCPGHWPGLHRGLQPVPAGKWHRPQPGGHPAEPRGRGPRPPPQRGPRPLLQQRQLQGGGPREAQGRGPGRGAGGVGLGLPAAHGRHSQPAARGPRRALRGPQHWGPPHRHQRDQPGGAAAGHRAGRRPRCQETQQPPAAQLGQTAPILHRR
ncbi:amyloid-beta A4 precursor protein-binding family A member 3 isoform X3 [Pteropus medius]|uniref:amyloid-beta A4 precursor protein-binding family A member 3 isoform X3 n=1 Tax=Pteropus vampyrus TaxID=132908 RepID=UPI00196A3BE9|nr:amyloid-beta A4 precursor protein-binding family A member 3 isoform X3 [Pteropus giganteus]